MKKIISFSLWGDAPKYTVGAVRNAQLAREIYPDWVARFYVGSSTPRSITNQLEQAGAEIVDMEVPGDWSGMLWRFRPSSDPDVEAMISRDTDSRLNDRERAAVDEWLASGRAFHIMRDHPAHRTRMPGGMWGVRGDALRDMDRLTREWSDKNYWQADQEFLAQAIYPIARQDAIVHDEFFAGSPFPTPRVEWEFVGDVFDEHDMRHPDYWRQLRDYVAPTLRNRLRRFKDRTLVQWSGDRDYLVR